MTTDSDELDCSDNSVPIKLNNIEPTDSDVHCGAPSAALTASCLNQWTRCSLVVTQHSGPAGDSESSGRYVKHYVPICAD